jgi:excisionase family DNA binding protein
MDKRREDHLDLLLDRKMMTVTEVATYLRVHRITIYRIIKAELPLGQKKIGRVWRFSREQLARFAEPAAAQDLEERDRAMTERPEIAQTTSSRRRSKTGP